MSDTTTPAILAAGQSRYDASIGKDRGTIWFTRAQVRAGADLSLGD